MAYSGLMKHAVISFIILFSFPVFSHGADIMNLFSPASGAIKLGTQESAIVIKSRLVKANFDIFKAKKARTREGVTIPKAFFLNLFDDIVLEADIQKAKITYSGGTVYTGAVKGRPDSQVILAVKGGIISGNITMPGHFYQVRYVSEGLHRIQEIDHARFPSEMTPIPVSSLMEEGLFSEDIELDSADLIDVLVVYTEAARSAMGGTVEMELLIDLAVAETNAGYENSGVNQRLRLVYTEEVVYSEDSFDWSTTLERLRIPDDSYMDNVHTMRDTYGADEVVLIVNNSEYCGKAYLMQTVSSSFAAYAFAVVSRTCAIGYYSFAHELGHNMGSAHDRDNAGVSGAYDYSYGYQDPDGAFRTIMAYNCPGGCTRVNYWSTPDKNYGGKPMGVVYTDPLAADNHMSLNNTASTVANFRQAVSPPPPPDNAMPWLMLLLGD